MIREAKLFVQATFPRSATAFAKTKEKVMSSYRGEKYVAEVFTSIYQRNDWSNPNRDQVSVRPWKR
jgi:hypothetical protein